MTTSDDFNKAIKDLGRWIKGAQFLSSEEKRELIRCHSDEVEYYHNLIRKKMQKIYEKLTIPKVVRKPEPVCNKGTFINSEEVSFQAKKNQVEQLAYDLLSKYGLRIQGWTFIWGMKKNAFGTCRFGHKVIELSYYMNILGKVDMDEIKDTLLHEIAHALVGAGHGHDSVWKRKAIEIGCTGRRISYVQNCSEA
jgi:hypothetical protein